MNHKKFASIVVCLSLMLGGAVRAAEDLRVLPESIEGATPDKMMSRCLRQLAQQQFESWKTRYEQLKTPEQVRDYQRSLREKFIEAIGGLPERTPLTSRITGVIERNGYRAEKIIFESQPRHYVSAVLFLPTAGEHSRPYPGVLVPCGHSANGKAHDAYQTMGALLALNGMAALVFDPIDQGERGQMLSEWPRLRGTRGHSMLGVGCTLLGRNTARFEIWDGMRAIDYLQSRPEVDANRIGCTGNSGGGTQTSYLMSLDKRIVAAAPSCYITGFERLLDTIGPQDAEQNIHGQIAFGMDHADYLMMRAPTPILICAATGDFFDIGGTWNMFRYAKRLYTRLGFAERIDLMENDAGHNYNQLQRQSVVRWMSRWLLGKDEPLTEPEITLLTEEQIQCAPGGQVMLLEGARSTYDLNRDFERELARRRKKLWTANHRAELFEEVRAIAGVRKLAEIPKPEMTASGVIERGDYVIRKMTFRLEDGIYLPALMFVPRADARRQRPVLYVHEQSKAADAEPGGPVEVLVKSGRRVLAMDVRGAGETYQYKPRGSTEGVGPGGKDVFTAYLLGRSYAGMRAEDVLVCARWLGAEVDGPVDLIAVGNVGIPALHAAALEPELFGAVKLERSLVSWANVIELGRSSGQQANAVFGALTTYDLPDLAATLGQKLTIKEPLDALGEPLRE